MPVKRLAVLATILFVVFIITGLPAAALWRWQRDAAPALELSGISGTLWRGRADQVTWHLAPLGELDWHWQPGWPPRWAVNVQGPGLNLQAQLHAGLQRLHLSQVQARWPAWMLRSPLTGVSLDGEFNAQLDTLIWLAQQPEQIDGRISWHNAQVLAPVAVDLGQIDIDLYTQQDAAGTLFIHLNLNSVSHADVSVRGSGQISAERYQLLLFLRAQQQRPQLNLWLRQVGTPTADGGVRVELSGTLRQGAQSMDSENGQ